MVSSATLTANTDYRFWISSHSGTFSDGVIMPTIPGNYRVDMLIDPTGAGSYSIRNHIYV